MTSVLPKVADIDRTHQGRPAAMTQARCWLVWLYSGDRRLPPGCLVSQASLVISVRFVTWAMFLPRIKMQRHDIKYPLVKYNQAPVLNSFFCFRLFAFKADYIAESPLPSLFNSTYCSHYPPRTVSWGLRSSRLPCVVLVFYHSLSRWTSPGNGMQPSSKAHFRINFQNNLLMTHNCEPKRDCFLNCFGRQTDKQNYHYSDNWALPISEEKKECRNIVIRVLYSLIQRTENDAARYLRHGLWSPTNSVLICSKFHHPVQLCTNKFSSLDLSFLSVKWEW